MCLAQGHNVAMPVRLEPVAPPSGFFYLALTNCSCYNVNDHGHLTRNGENINFLQAHCAQIFFLNSVDLDQLASGEAS